MNPNELDLPEKHANQSVLGRTARWENIGKGKILQLGVGEICAE
jgi:hypothetical protein